MNTNFDEVRARDLVARVAYPDRVYRVVYSFPSNKWLEHADGEKTAIDRAKWSREKWHIISQPETKAPEAQPAVGSYEWHIQDVSTDPNDPPFARFEEMFEEGWRPEHMHSVLTYLGIECRFLSEDWGACINGDPLTRAEVMAIDWPSWIAEGGWTLASAWDTEDAQIMCRFVRPLVKEPRS